jgi:rhodanese-related sulfurtransferase
MTTTATQPELETIRPEDLREPQRITLIDVRTPVEFEQVHAAGARNVPLDRLDAGAILTESNANANANRPIYLICKSGARGAKACKALSEACANTPRRIVNVAGGMDAWVAAGLPVVRGQSRAISLERQVRIAAGTLVLIGVALGWLVHPWLFGLSAFVGAGLVFAGVTDTCGMGTLLARMPWNTRATK